MTSNSQFRGAFSLNEAVVMFGRWKIKMSLRSSATIVFYMEASYVSTLIDLLRMLIEEIRDEAFPHLNFTLQAKLEHHGLFEFDLFRSANAQHAEVTDLQGNVIAHAVLQPWLPLDEKGLYDCFLSYRVKTDRDRVRAVYDCLSLLAMDDQNHPPKVFFDSKCLDKGQEWDVAFATALSQTSVFVPLISPESVRSIMERNREFDDNFVLEWALAIELKRVGRVKAIVPLFMASSILKLDVLPDHVNTKVNAKCIDMLVRFHIDLSATDKTRIEQQTVRQIGIAMSMFQGIVYTEQPHSSSRRTNWALFRTITTSLSSYIKQHRITSQQIDPNVAELMEWFKSLGMADQSEVSKHSQLTFEILQLGLANPSTMESQLQQLGLSGAKADIFKKKLTSHVLGQSIQGWLSQPSVDLAKYYDKFKSNQCHTFKALFEVADDDDLFTDVLKEVGIEGLQARMLKKKVKIQQTAMVGNEAN